MRACLLVSLTLLASPACHPGPVVDTGPKPAVIDGTIAGIVSTDTNAPVEGRKVTATNVASGEQYTATTATNGGYTMKVPQGTYRLEVQLAVGETVLKQPAETKVDKSDLDPHRDFVLTIAKR